MIFCCEHISNNNNTIDLPQEILSGKNKLIVVTTCSSLFYR